MHDGEETASTSDEVVVRKRRKGIYILPNLFFAPWCWTAWTAASPA